MKIFISLVVTFLTMAQAEARSILPLNLAQYEFAVSADKSFEKITATFSSDGFLFVQAQPLNSMELKDSKFINAQKHLDSRNVQFIKRMVLRLANAKIIESFSDIVCKIAITPEVSIDHLSTLRDYNYETQNFEGQMTLIKGPTSCAIAHHVSLEHIYQNNNANILKNSLKVLALEIIGSKLDQIAAVVE